jgi:hypothetical protein
METAAQMNGPKRTWADSALMTFVRFAFGGYLHVAVDHFRKNANVSKIGSTSSRYVHHVRQFGVSVGTFGSFPVVPRFSVPLLRFHLSK